MIKRDNKRISITLNSQYLLYLNRIMLVKGYKTYTRAIKFLIDLYKINNNYDK